MQLRRLGYARRELTLLMMLSVASLIPTSVAAQRVDSVGVIRGVVLETEGNTALGFAIVSLDSGGEPRFTDDSGRFVFGNLAAGVYRLRARQLGFTPLDTSIEVTAGATATVRLRLAPVVLRLAAVRVVAPAACTAPGPPDARREPEMHTVFEQLRENARRYRLLAEERPFRYRVERTTMVMARDSSVLELRVDSLLIDGRAGWRYAPGAMVVAHRSHRREPTEVMLQLPTLPVFADSIFHRNHCFSYGGIERRDGREYLRIDFEASARIKSPDVAGSVWLDVESYQIRRADFRLTRSPRQLRGIKSLSVTTLFREVLPAIPIFDQISATTTITAKKATAPALATEFQQLVAFGFLEEPKP